MPDRCGFNELGREVACIQEGCLARGPIWKWPEQKRREHQLSHGTSAHSPAPRRTIHSGNGTEDTMAASKEKVSGRQACIAAIRAAGKPLTANEIATAVIASGIVPTLKGKTPKATLSAQITSGAKKGETFKRVGSGKPAKFDLKPDAPNTDASLVDALREAVKAAAAPKPAVAKEPTVPKASTPPKEPAVAAAAPPSGGKGDQVTPDPKPVGKAK